VTENPAENCERGQTPDDLTPEEEAWCEDFFRNLFPEPDDDNGGQS
jgi:hypothetical protein